MKSNRKKRRTKQQRASLAGVSARNPRPVSLPMWDHGATGPANRAGLVVEERGETDPATGRATNPNGVTGVRRRDLLLFWVNRGSISVAGYNAAIALRGAFEATQRRPPCLPDNDRVQSSPKPDAAIDIQIDRISRYHAIRRHVCPGDWRLIEACVMEGQHPARLYGALRSREGFADLRDALDRLSDSLAKMVVKHEKRC